MSIIFRIIRFDSTSPPVDAEFKWDVMGGTMGRSSSNDWVLPDTNRYLSGRHAILRCQNGDYYITDTSTNGVFINQKPVPLGRDNSARLENGDTLKMGGYVMEVLLDSEKSSGSKMPPETTSVVTQEADHPFDIKDDFPKRPTPGKRKVESDDPFSDFNSSFDKDELPQKKDEPLPLAEDFWDNSDSSSLSTSHDSQLSDDPFFSDGDFMVAGTDSERTPDRRSIDDTPLADFYQPPDIQKPDNGKADSHISEKPGKLPDNDFGLLESKVQPGFPDEDDPFDFSAIAEPLRSKQRDSTVEPEIAEATSSAQAIDSIMVDSDLDDPFDFSGIGIDTPEPKKTEAVYIDDGTKITERVDLTTADRPEPVLEQAVIAEAETGDAALIGQGGRVLSVDSGKPDVHQELPAGQDIQKLLAGMGIMDESARRTIAEHVSPEKIGQLFRILLQGSMDVLRTRTEIKSEMRMDVTTIRPIQNNPVKFSVNVDDALLKLLMPQGASFMKPELALAEAFDDIKAHQVAVIAGVQASLKLVMKRFDPDKLVERLQKQNRILANIPIQRQARLWGLFEELYSTIEEEAADDFQRLFGLEFSRAYEKQIEQLEMMRRD